MNFNSKLLLCLLALVLALLLLGNNTASKPTQAALSRQPLTLINTSGQSGQSGQAHDIQGAPSISAQQIDAILCAASSPACHTGQALYTYGKEYGIDPAYALAFFKHESSFGKYGVASSNLGIGNIRCSAGYSCLHGFRAYQSWQEGYEDWYRLISWYIHELHKSTIETIVPTYAPSVENDTTGYISAVVSSVMTWRQSGQVASK